MAKLKEYQFPGGDHDTRRSAAAAVNVNVNGNLGKSKVLQAVVLDVVTLERLRHSREPPICGKVAVSEQRKQNALHSRSPTSQSEQKALY